MSLQPGWVFQKFGIPEGFSKDHRTAYTVYNLGGWGEKRVFYGRQ